MAPLGSALLPHTFFLLLLLSGAFAAPCHAEEKGSPPPSDLADPGFGAVEKILLESEKVLSSGGTLIELKKAPYVATIITAEEIADSGALTLSEALEMVPGLHVSLTTYGRLNPVYSIRGIHTRLNPQVLILVNGNPMTSFPGSRPFDFELPVENISRIEVIRGPGSAIYGADAFSGVINVITKDASEVGGTVAGVKYGSFDTRSLWAQHGNHYGNVDVAFSLEWLKTNGDEGRRIESDTQTVFDTAFGTDASLAPGPLATNQELINAQLEARQDNWTARLWHWQTRHAGLGVGLALALDNEGSETVRMNTAELIYRTDDLLPDWDISLQGLYRQFEGFTKYVLFPPGAIVPIGADGNIDVVSPVGFPFFPEGVIGLPGAEEDIISTEAVAFYSGLRDHRLRLSMGYRYHEAEGNEVKNYGPGVLDGTETVVDSSFLTDVTGTENVYLPKSIRRVWHAAVQDEWFLAKRWSLTGGARYDHYSDFGGTFNPRLALVWEARDDLTAKLLYGRAFRAPSLVELYVTNNPSAFGNPNLDPERVDTYELAFNYRPLLNLETAASFFVYNARDLIEYVPDPSGRTARAQNIRDQRGYGCELQADWHANPYLDLTANFSFQKSWDPATDAPIPEAPKYTGWLMAAWRLPHDWRFNNIVTWVGERQRAEGDPRPEVDDYALVDLVLRKERLLGRADLSLTVKNLFNTTAYEPSSVNTIPDDYPLAGRSAYLGMRYHF